VRRLPIHALYTHYRTDLIIILPPSGGMDHAQWGGLGVWRTYPRR